MSDKPPSYQQAMSTPMNAQSMGAKGGGPSTNSMISVNNLVYNLEPDLSVVTNATFKQHFFQQNEYTSSQRATCILNTGADYLDTRRSWLVFSLLRTRELNPDGDETTKPVEFGPLGTALNLINRVTVTSRSGDELSRCRRLNLKKASILPYKMETEWWESVGQSMGKDKTIPTEVEERFVIPLYCLSDLFGYGRFLPSMLTSGMRIEIEWETPEVAFVSTDPSVSVGSAPYKIGSMHINARSIQLTDAVQRHLNELSATNGLEIVYTDWETTELSKTTGTSINLEVRKAASRALKAYAKIRDHTDTEGTRDSMATQEFDCVQHQWQLGSLYFPHQPIKTSQDSDPWLASQESYLHCLDSFAPKSGLYKSAVPYSAPPNETVSGRLESKSNTTATNTIELGALVFKDLRSEVSVGDQVLLFAGQLMPIIRTVRAITDQTCTLDRPVASGIYRTFRLLPFESRANAFSAGTNFQTNASLLACCLERSALFNLSGIPINNSRILLLRATTSLGTAKDVTIFLQYVKLARIFLNNCEVEE